jgi:hypothetical protein
MISRALLSLKLSYNYSVATRERLRCMFEVVYINDDRDHL